MAKITISQKEYHSKGPEDHPARLRGGRWTDLATMLEPDLASAAQRGWIDLLQIDWRSALARSSPALSRDFHQAVQIVAEFVRSLDKIAHWKIRRFPEFTT